MANNDNMSAQVDHFINHLPKMGYVWALLARRYARRHPPLYRLAQDLWALAYFGIFGLFFYGLVLTFPTLIPYLNKIVVITSDGPFWALILPVIYFTTTLVYGIFLLVSLIEYLRESLKDRRQGFSFLLYPLTGVIIFWFAKAIDWAGMGKSIVKSIISMANLQYDWSILRQVFFHWDLSSFLYALGTVIAVFAVGAVVVYEEGHKKKAKKGGK